MKTVRETYTFYDVYCDCIHVTSTTANNLCLMQICSVAIAASITERTTYIRLCRQQNFLRNYLQ